MMKRTLSLGLLIGAAAFASAQVSSIDSANVFRQFTDDTDATYAAVDAYPTLISLSETNVDGTPGGGTFANRDNWEFSNDGGGTSYAFSNDDFFSVSMDVTLAVPPNSGVSPRKEAGYLLSTLGGQASFIVNSDAGEIVAFGAPLPFYSFNASNGLSYTPGETITLGIDYFFDPMDGLRKIVYSANGIMSPALTFSNLELGIIDGSTLGGYLQVPIDTTNSANGGIATFANIKISPVPEPASFAALGLGALALLRRRRR